ncbi:MAG: hypothetical protein K0S18_122 [Anaerocolumna sp.]|nr:hypothetical protein [Anaerocolumna sp.]
MERENKLDIKKAIEIIQGNINAKKNDELQAIEIAVREMKKSIAMKPINNGNWVSKTCPTCGEGLSEHHGDGYYSDNICLESCPNCRQLLDWDD